VDKGENNTLKRTNRERSDATGAITRLRWKYQHPQLLQCPHPLHGTYK